MPENYSLLIDKKFVLQSPPPWRLKGQAIALIFKFNQEWVKTHGQLPKNLKGKFKGGLGLLLLASYSQSPIGAFQEVLFIPGKFRKTRKQTITKLFTNTDVSAQNGQSNWGIPKEKMQIEWTSSEAYDKVSVVYNGSAIFSAEFESTEIPIPASTAFFPLRLCQTWNKMNYFTRISGSGWGKLAKVKSLDLNPAYFPDIRETKPLLTLKINHFCLRIPKPTYKEELI